MHSNRGRVADVFVLIAVRYSVETSDNTGCAFKHKHSGTTGTFHQGEHYLQGSFSVLK